jgi:hypothetical protein
LFEAIQRQVIDVLADQHPNDQARRGHAAINHRRWNGCCDYALTGTAGVLRANVPMHKKLCRRDVQLLADVFADLHQRAAALAAGAADGLVIVLGARQMLRQWLPTGALARDTRCAHLLLGLGGNGGAIRLNRLAK